MKARLSGSFLSISKWSVVLAVAFLSISPLSHAGYGSVDEARDAESRCMKKFSNPARISCLEGIIDWWFHEGGNHVPYNPYLEMTRIMQIQLKMDPTLLETLSNLAYYTFSIEVDAILNHTLPDFTYAPILAFSEYEATRKNSSNFFFYYLSVDTLELIIAEKPPIGSPEIKRAYYRELKRRYQRAAELWAQFDKTRVPAQFGTAEKIEFQLARGQRFLAKYKKYDDQAALTR